MFTLDLAHAAARAAFARASDRVLAVRINGWTVTVLVDTSHRGGLIRVSELADLAEGLGVPLEMVGIWADAIDRCEVQVELEDTTPIDARRVTVIENPR